MNHTTVVTNYSVVYLNLRNYILGSCKYNLKLPCKNFLLQGPLPLRATDGIVRPVRLLGLKKLRLKTFAFVFNSPNAD